MPVTSPRAAGARSQTTLFFSLPLGITVVVGGDGRDEIAAASFTGPVSFLGFLVNLLLR